MKATVLYSSIICIACLSTLLIFQDFRKKREAAEAFHGIVHNTPLNMRLMFIAPEQIKVENWEVGESSVYHLKTNAESKQLAFHVAARDAKGGDQFWLRSDGFLQFNEVEFELWRLLDKTNLRPGSEKRGFFFPHNGIPVSLPSLKYPSTPIILEELGNEVLVTPVGALECQHFLAYIRSPDAELEPFVELWTNPAIHPLGLVRARWREAFLDLVEVNRKKVPKIPPVLLSEFDRNTHLDGSCSRCHANGIGGKDLKLESIDWLSGTELNLTDAPFHYREAKIHKPGDLIPLQPTEESGRAGRRTLVRFSWEKGSFWVKPNEKGILKLSLDAIAHQGNITVQTRTGRLGLDFRK